MQWTGLEKYEYLRKVETKLENFLLVNKGPRWGQLTKNQRYKISSHTPFRVYNHLVETSSH
jgi:hypothetical protein